MKGRIRAKGTCPRCHKPFTDVSRGISMHKSLGYICVSCKTVPGRFYLDLHHLGKRVRIFSDSEGVPLDRYQKAVLLLNDILREAGRDGFDHAVFCREGKGKFLVSSLLDTFIARKQESVAPSYRQHYRRYGDLVKDFLGSRDIRTLGGDDLLNFKVHLEGRSACKEKTIKNILDYLKTFLRYCRKDLKVLHAVPVFPEIKVPDYRHAWLSREDQRSVLQRISDDDRPIIAFLMLHGCRPSEARALKCRDVDLQTDSITIAAAFSGNVFRTQRSGRTSRTLTIPIHPQMFDFLAERVKNDLPESPVFLNPRTGACYSSSSLDRAWFHARKQAGLDKRIRLYDASRHSFASQLLSGGASLFAVSKLLGHSCGRVAEKYVRQRGEDTNSDAIPLGS